MTLYECLAAGTPAVVRLLADNQKPAFDELYRERLIVPCEPDLAQAVERVARDPALRAELGARGRAAVDGRGAARVAAELVRVIAPAAPSGGRAGGPR